MAHFVAGLTVSVATLLALPLMRFLAILAKMILAVNLTRRLQHDRNRRTNSITALH